MRYKHFTKDERNELSILLKKDYSLRDIGRVLGRNPSSISREVTNNSVNGIYDPKKAQQKAYRKRKYSKYQGMKIREHPLLEEYVGEKLKDGWTPEQIAGRLKLENGNKSVIGFKSIYKWLDTGYGARYAHYLPRYKAYKRKRKRKGKKEIIKNRVFIDKRPEIINQRKRIRDFEGDTLGTPKSSKATISGAVDRKSRYLLGKKISRPKEAMIAYKELLQPYNPLSITFDSGPENTRYAELGILTFFCHPYSAWEKGTIENTFQRLRRYIPKKANISNYSQEEISAIIDKMNNIPRKCLGFRTPREVFFDEPIQLQVSIFQLTGCCTSG